jgi:hypothetical protein
MILPIRDSAALPDRPKVELTRKRLWVLYQLAGMIKREIEDLTGWTRKEIDAGLDRFDLRAWSSESHWATTMYLATILGRVRGETDALDRARSADDIVRALETTADARLEFQRMLRDAILLGPVDWNEIDALPWPEELRGNRDGAA